jgi:hypothetical protein
MTGTPEITPEYAAYEAYVMAAPDDLNFLEWEELPGWQREAIRSGVQAAFERRAMAATGKPRGQTVYDTHHAVMHQQTGKRQSHHKAFENLTPAVRARYDAAGQAVAGPLEAENKRLRAQVGAGDAIIRDVLESLCRRDGLSLESAVTPGEPARNYALADRLGIGHVFGLLDPGDSVADHPDDCRGTCCEDARREAEAARDADSETDS